MSKPKSNNLPSSLVSGGRRRIGDTPLKTLDAPGIGDDFYFNLMDWSSTGLIAIGLSSCCYVWDSETGETNEVVDVQTLKSSLGGGPGSCITSVKWDSEGNHLAIGTDSGFTQLYDISTLQRTRTLKPTSSQEGGGGPDSLKVNVMAWANDGTFNQGFFSGLIREHDVRIRESITKDFPDAHSGQVVGLEWREDSALLASGGNDNVVKVWDRRSDIPKMKKENHNAAVKVSLRLLFRLFSLFNVILTALFLSSSSSLCSRLWPGVRGNLRSWLLEEVRTIIPFISGMSLKTQE